MIPASDPHLWRPYTQMHTADPPLPVVRTHGSRIVLADGRELIDGIASWWTACHGYNHPHIANAVRDQLARMPHIMFGGLTHEPAATLARRLAALLPATPHVFFSDSGSVAVEVAMKMAAQYWLNRGIAGRKKFLSFKGGYHGDTLATMSVCDPTEGMHAHLAGLFPQQLVVSLPQDGDDFDEMFNRHAHTLAAVLIEPLVQGAGGMMFHSPAVLHRLRAACDRHALPMIFDEVFTGFGRTGTMFACQGAGVTPDIITLSKALTAGTMGLAATLAAPHIFAAFQSDRPEHALMHGPTFMANPLACAAANASLDLFERHDRLAEVATIAAALRTGLAPCRTLPAVRDVRVLGAIGAVELTHPPNAATLKARLLAAGVWVRPLGRVLYLTPAFTIPPGDLATLTAALYTTLRDTPHLPPSP